MKLLGKGLDGPPCRERETLPQTNPTKLPVQKMCMRCGRVTARKGDDGLPWCGGAHHMTGADNQPRYKHDKT